jgi:MFS family permease
MTVPSEAVPQSRWRALAVAIGVTVVLAQLGLAGGLFALSIGRWILAIGASLAGVAILALMSRTEPRRAVFFSFTLFGITLVVSIGFMFIGIPIGIPAAFTLATGVAASYALRFRSIESIQRRTAWVIGAFAVAFGISLVTPTSVAVVLSAPLAFVAVGMADMTSRSGQSADAD